jgi:hypothetical protein
LGSQFMTRSCAWNADRVCASCTVCDVDAHLVSTCHDYEDSVCIVTNTTTVNHLVPPAIPRLRRELFVGGWIVVTFAIVISGFYILVGSCVRAKLCRSRRVFVRSIRYVASGSWSKRRFASDHGATVNSAIFDYPKQQKSGEDIRKAGISLGTMKPATAGAPSVVPGMSTERQSSVRHRDIIKGEWAAVVRTCATASALITSLVLFALRDSCSTATVPLLTSLISTLVLSGTFVAVFAYASLSHRDRRLAFVLHFKRNRRAIAVLLVVSCLHARLLRLLTSSFGGSKAFRAPLSAASRLAISSFSAAATVTFDLVHVFFLVRSLVEARSLSVSNGGEGPSLVPVQTSGFMNWQAELLTVWCIATCALGILDLMWSMSCGAFLYCRELRSFRSDGGPASTHDCIDSNVPASAMTLVRAGSHVSRSSTSIVRTWNPPSKYNRLNGTASGSRQSAYELGHECVSPIKANVTSPHVLPAFNLPEEHLHVHDEDEIRRMASAVNATAAHIPRTDGDEPPCHIPPYIG